MSMTAREKDILKMRLNRYKLREIGEKYHISKQRVYQILRRLDKKRPEMVKSAIPTAS